MRQLTIKRIRSFVGCMGKVSVFITDPAGDKTVCGDACRLLGLLGNGKTEVYDISEQSAKLYLVAGTEMFNDSTVIPEGTGDVYLEGQNRYDPMHGNAFILSSNDSGEKTADRKKRNTKALLLLFLVPLIVGLCIGLIPHFIKNSPGKPKRFVCDGMSIELTDKFEERENVNYTTSYVSGDIAVIDRSLEPEHGDVVVGYVDKEFTVKFLDMTHQHEGWIELKPANKHFRPIRIDQDSDFKVWGVVVYTIKKWK